MRNEKCGTTLIGRSGKPRDRCLSAYYHNLHHNWQCGKMQTRNAENANTKTRMHLVPNTYIITHIVGVFKQ